MAISSSVHPFLWSDDQAEQAATLDTSLLPSSRITQTRRYPVAALRAAADG